ncbi:hypothetical protein [Mycobacterium sp. URHB0021]
MTGSPNIWRLRSYGCPQCGPEWSAEDIRSAPLRSLNLAQLVAIHLMSLDDDSLRHFFPPYARMAAGGVGRRRAAGRRRLVRTADRLPGRPPLLPRLSVRAGSPGLVRIAVDGHSRGLAHRRDGARREAPRRSCRRCPHHRPAVPIRFQDNGARVLRTPRIGDRLQEASFAAGTDVAARQLSAAHELWTVCRP